jgi:curli biogenesis system outer membrane secretion channel CsgG
MKKITMIVVGACLLSACGLTDIKQGGVENTATGSASSESNSATGENKTVTLHKCSKPLGVAALVEPESSSSQYAAILSQHKLPSAIPMLKLLMAQSGCFQVVDRGAGSQALAQERALASSGELSSSKNTRKGQMVSADWVITPNIIFQDNNAGGNSLAIGRLAGGLFGPIGALVGNINVTKQEAQTLLTAVSVQTGLQEAVAEGSAKKQDVGFGAIGLGGSFGAGGGAYSSTDIGKLVTVAFVDAHNKLVMALQNP